MRRDEALLTAFADELRSLRGSQNLSQEQLASIAGVNRTYVAKLETGKNQPTLSVMHSLAGALHRDLADMISDTLDRYRKISGLPPREQYQVVKRRYVSTPETDVE